MKTNLSAKTIELTKTEMKNAMTYGTKEYDALQAIRRDYPGFEIVEAVKVKKSKSDFASLNLATIKAYVKANGSPEQKKELLTISNATITDDSVIIPAQPFPYIKKWFLAEFPQYKAALEAHDAEIVRIFDAVDAKIAEAQKRIAEEVRAKAEAEAKSFLEIA